jgi:hypothetical protein
VSAAPPRLIGGFGDRLGPAVPHTLEIADRDIWPGADDGADG